MPAGVNPAGAVLSECEFPDPPSEVGPGLDSDFGASAGAFQSERCRETLAAGCPDRDLCVLRRFSADSVSRQ